MSLNCSEIDLILKEADLDGAFIQKVLQPSYTSLVFGLYKNSAFNLFFSLEGSSCRLNISKKKFLKPQTPLRFMELLRARVLGMQIKGVKQINANRIVKFTLENTRTNEELFLYVRLWSGAANIILTDSKNKIIDAFYRRPKKGETTGNFFLQEEKVDDETITARLKKFPVRDYNKDFSFNDFVDKNFESENNILNVENLQKEIELYYLDKISLLQKEQNLLKEKINELKNHDELKKYGDLILANIVTLKTGVSFFETVDYTSGELITIKLNDKKKPQENAQLYYDEAKKILSGKKSLVESINNLDCQILKLKTEAETAKTETRIPELKKILEKINPNAKNKIFKRKAEKDFPGLKFNIKGFLVFVGRNANENDELLRHCVRGLDLWMHVRDYSGSYVFIKAQNKKSFPLELLLATGNMAVYYSKAKKAEAAAVYYTEVKNLRRAKNAKKGTVLPQNEKTLFIKLDKNILKRIL